MKITAIIMISTAITASATGHSQTVTLDLKKAPVQKVFKEVMRQTGVSIVYSEQLFSDVPPISIKVKDATVTEVMDHVLQNTGLSYSYVGKTLVIKPSVTVDLQSTDNSLVTQPPPPIDVTGKVTDENNNPLVGATVSVKGTKTTVKTDDNGVFVLKNVDENATLEISYVGFETQTISVNSKTNISLSLKRSDNPLDVVQIEAYRTNIRRFSTSNITTVKGADIAKQPVNNPLLALEGRVSGLFITQSNGLPGSGVTVRIQGQNSINRGNDPLYVIDGVPYFPQLLPTSLGSILQTSGGPVINGVPSGYGNPLNYINSGDIESIDVLKDADATAIYGSRAANGAILITTKKGKVGKTKVDFNVRNGWGKVTRKIDYMNTQQYIQMRLEAKRNDNAAITSTDYDINGFWDSTSNTDWQKVLIGGTANYTDASANISGGNVGMQYLVGGTFHRETTVFPGNLSDIKGSVHFNINSSSTNQKFRLQFSGNYLIDNNHLIQSDLTNLVYQFAPDAPALYNADGTLNWAPTASGSSSWFNPLKYLLQKYNNKTNNLISNAILSYHITKGFEIKSSFGYTDMRTNELLTTPLTAYAPERRATSVRSAVYGNGLISSWIIEPQATYKLNFKNAEVETLIGTSIEHLENNGQQIFAEGFSSDRTLEDIKSATYLQIGTTTASVYKYNALFGRISYNWQEKYVVNFTARRDGSSRYGSRSRFHNFGSVAGAWIFSNESFIKNSWSFLSFGKLKANYGTTGNDQIGDYQFMNLYNPFNVGVPYQGIGSITPNSLPNPHYHWEETRKLQFGLDLGFLKDKILFSAYYYRNRSSNQILPYALPMVTGFTSIPAINFPATIQNIGWELSINTTNIRTKQVTWTSNLNLTIPKNKLVDFQNLASSSYAGSLVIGQPITMIRVFHFLGVDATTGSYMFADKDGNKTSSPNFSTDRTVIINTAPKFYGGFSNSVSYKGFQLEFLFQFVKQIGANSKFGYFRPPGSKGSFGNNQPTSVLTRWQKPGDVTNIQRYNSNSSLSNQFTNAQGSDAGYSDASFLRLKNLALAWQLPETWKQKIHFQQCQIYLQCQNLLTITKYQGMDPENRSISSLPPLRIITFGIQAGF